MTYKLPTLSFEYNALTPFIDPKTMEIHHSRHHQGYVDKLNHALKDSRYKDTPLEKILTSASKLPSAIRNNGGGHYNHSLFWDILSPEGKPKPEGKLAQAINESFHSLEAFKNTFSEIAATQFGSGWAWLVISRQSNELTITSTSNQDNPLMDVADIQGIPIMGLDLWEHAYYLNYQNDRAAYIDAFWNVLDWNAVEKNFENSEQASESSWEKLLRFTSTAIQSQSMIF
jgi:Fe-Mn family superoxide dismutase